MIDKEYTYIGVDVAKVTLRVQTPTGNIEVPNDAKGVGRILSACGKVTDALVVLEATGGYERLLLEKLHRKGLPCHLASPQLVRAFIRSEGVKAKNDPIDARMLVQFGQEKRLQPMEAPSPQITALKALVDRRSQLVGMRSMEKTRLQNSPRIVHASIKAMICTLNKQINGLDKQIREHIAHDATLKRQHEVICAIEGVGEVTSVAILTYLPEITRLDRNAVTALAGLAPYDNDSGKKRGKRSIYGGRPKIRTCLYMATIAALRCNAVIREYVRRLTARGKVFKCAIVAAMRKLLLHIRAQLCRLESELLGSGNIKGTLCKSTLD